ncbi:uncharacterized protein [Amphiura filiformis]|uniref:uncharacterized protein n=1 Tax=Amphiura filiformis TaxID=82378 RepID=UPI003B2201E7
MSAVMAWGIGLSFLLTVLYLADHTEALTIDPTVPMCNCQPPPCLTVNGKPIIFPGKFNETNSIDKEVIPVNPVVQISCPVIDPLVSFGPQHESSYFFHRSVCVKRSLDELQETNWVATDELDNGRQYCTALNADLFGPPTTMTSTSYGMTTTSATSTDDDTSTTDDIADDTKKSTSTTEQSTNMTTKPRCGSENDIGSTCVDKGALSTRSRCRNCGWLVLLFLLLLPLSYAAWRYRHKIRIWIRSYYKPSDDDPEANCSPSAASSLDASKNTGTAATQKEKDDPKNAAGTYNNPAYEENEVGKVNDKTKENKKNSVDEQTNNNDDKKDSKSDQRNNTKTESNNGMEENSKPKEGTFKTAAIQKAAANDSGKNRKHSGNRKSGTGQGKLKTLPD